MVTESVSAMNEDSRNSVSEVVGLLAQETCLLVDEFVDEVLDLVLILVGRVLSLLEEVGRWVLNRFHLNIGNIMVGV